MRLSRFLAAALLIAAVGTVLAPSASAAPAQLSVMISNFAFSPSALTVHAGDVVTWTNHDVAPHDVTVTRGPVAVHSPTLTTGQSWTYTFTVVGSYAYICSIHPDMHATLTVAAAQPPPPPSAAPSPTASPTASRLVPSTAAAAPRPTAAHSAMPAAHGHTASPATATTPAPTSSSSAAAVVSAASTPPSAPRLRPLLLLAGLVAAVAVFCLLVLVARPDDVSST